MQGVLVNMCMPDNGLHLSYEHPAKEISLFNAALQVCSDSAFQDAHAVANVEMA